ELERQERHRLGLPDVDGTVESLLPETRKPSETGGQADDEEAHPPCPLASDDKTDQPPHRAQERDADDDAGSLVDERERRAGDPGDVPEQEEEEVEVAAALRGGREQAPLEEPSLRRLTQPREVHAVVRRVERAPREDAEPGAGADHAPSVQIRHHADRHDGERDAERETPARPDHALASRVISNRMLDPSSYSTRQRVDARPPSIIDRLSTSSLLSSMYRIWYRARRSSQCESKNTRL